MSMNREARGTKRAGESIGGQFAKSKQTESAGTGLDPDPFQAMLNQADPFHGLRRPEWYVSAQPYSTENPIDWQGNELGLDGVGVTNVTATGDPACGEGRLEAIVYEDPVSAGNLTQAQMDRGWQHVEHTLRTEYGVDIVDDGADEHITLSFSAPLHSEAEVSDVMATEVLWERSELVRFSNESDRGTYGSPHIYSRIGHEIDEGFFPGTTVDGSWNHSRLDEMKALARAMTNTRAGHNLPQVNMLASRGYCTDADVLLTEVHLISPDFVDTTGTRRLKAELNAELDAQRRSHTVV